MASNFFKLSPTYVQWSKDDYNTAFSSIIDSLFQFMDKRYSIELDKNQLRKELARIGVSTSPKTIHLALSAINLTVAYLNEGQEQTRMIKEEERALGRPKRRAAFSFSQKPSRCHWEKTLIKGVNFFTPHAGIRS